MSHPDLPAALEDRPLQLFAPAKINLALHVLGRRDDGYHELDSIFLPLAWGDDLELTLSPATSPEVICRCPERPELGGPDNLAARAALAWLEARAVAARVEILLHKRIWVAAGLGGGSSDAGAVLRGLEGALLADGRPAGPTLAELALALGADVPFFLDPRPARARGVGEALTPLAGRGPRDLALVLANPGRPLATPEVFRALGLARGERLRETAAELPSTLPATLEALAALVHNDLEPAATALCPEIAAMRQALNAAGAIASGLSGSGPTVFGLFPTVTQAARAAETCSTIHGFSTISTALAVA